METGHLERDDQTTYGNFIESLKESEITPLSNDAVCAEIRITRDPQQNDENRLAARKKIYESSLRLIPFAIKNYGRKDIPPEELVAESLFVLDSCIDNYDFAYTVPETGEPAKFSTYFIRSVAQKFKQPDWHYDPDIPVLLPKYVKQYAFDIARAHTAFVTEEGRRPSGDEWYAATKAYMTEKYNESSSLPTVSKKVFIATNEANRPPIRLDNAHYTGAVDPETLEPELQPNEEVIADPTLDLNRHLERRYVTELLETLPPREALVLTMHYGLNDQDPNTMDEIANFLGVSRGRVHQLEHKAKNRIVRALKAAEREGKA
jgi:RNA polymerase sigma factor (sigma-70 family)